MTDLCSGAAAERADECRANSFVRLRKQGLYVDKTERLCTLCQAHWPSLLARPSGFGKTVCLDTIEELFTRGVHTAAFAGLKIASQ